MDFTLLFIITYIILSLILGIIIYFLRKLIEILLTSSIGCYTLVRGVSLLLGGFPDEEFVSMLLKYKEMNQLKQLFVNESVFYTIFLFVLFITSIIIQWNTFEEPKKEENTIKKSRKSIKK